MYTNAKTGKGWTDAEEATFADIMAASRLTRVKAIQLWKRCRKNASKAVQTARHDYPVLTQATLDRVAKMQAARWHRVSIDGNHVQQEANGRVRLPVQANPSVF